MKPVSLTDAKLTPGDFLANIADDDLVYFCCNVGDADAQVVLLPTSIDKVRRAIVVDAGITDKVVDLLHALENAKLLSFTDPTDTTLPLVVATHPHHDHVAGMEQLITTFGDHIGEFWEPGFFHTTPSYANMLRAVSQLPSVVYTQPTSGLRRFFGPVAVTVLSPSIHLRNRFDTYGVEINDSSISLRFEHPARAVLDKASLGGQANWASDNKSGTLILGGDAQTLSWSFVSTDFPFLAASETGPAKAIAAATGGTDLLSADVFKVSHHASKHGVNLELVERIDPSVTIVSSTAAGPNYGFPHTVTQNAIREALDPVAGSKPDAVTGLPRDHRADEDLGIFYTSDTTTAAGQPNAGSVAVILRGKRRQLWRFGDGVAQPIDLTHASRWT